jgi:hypothetical protein
MPFKKERGRTAAISDKGFRVEKLESAPTDLAITYREGDHVIDYRLENIYPGSCVIYIERMPGWEPPFADETITEHRKAVIAERIAAAMDFMGQPCEVVYPPGSGLKEQQ